MNSKIKNYVDVLFKGIPNTKKAQELKEEILSNLNEHFEAHIAEGKSENQAYTESLADLGDVDELLKTLEPERDLKVKIDEYRKVRARNTSISVMLYIMSVICVIIFGSIADLFNAKNGESLEVIGVVLMFGCIAVATGLLIYTRMSMPQDVSDYISRGNQKNFMSYHGSNQKLRNLAAFMKLYWLVVLLVYLSVSFATHAWYITWMIWIIGAAVKNAIFLFFDTTDSEINGFDKD